MRLCAHNLPYIIFDFREISVSLKFPIHQGYIKPVRLIYHLAINAGATYYEDAALSFLGCFNGMIQVGIIINPCNLLILPDAFRHHDITPVWKRPAYRIKGLPPHYDNIAGGVGLKKLKVLRQVPGKCAILAYYTAFGHCHNDIYLFHGQTATPNLIKPWGS